MVLLILALADGFETHRWKAAFARFSGYLPGLAAGAFLSILLATRGHPASYLQFTRGVASWQFWYFGIHPYEKICGLPQLLEQVPRRSWLHFGFYLAAMLYCLFLLRRKRAGDRVILFVFLYTSIIAGQAAYILGCGVDGFSEGSYCFFLLLVLALLLEGALRLLARLKRGPLLRAAAAGLCSLYLIYSLGLDLALVRQNRALAAEPDYLPALGGVHPYAGSLLAMEEAVAGGSLFSTYATALDDLRGGFQPTGCDYIIHALGQPRFDAYLQDFTENRYDFVQTTNYTAWPWEPYVVGVSWELYRTLYREYDLYSDYAYWTLWRYAGPGAHLLDAQPRVTVEQLDPQRVQVTVTCDAPGPCYVDLALSWENRPAGGAGRLLYWQRAVFVEDGGRLTATGGIGEGYFQPAQGQRRHLPVYLQDGSGSIVLCGQPAETSQLAVTEAVCGEVIEAVR